ncbi:MAG: choline/ethanolamine kinase family protein [Woeseiaceae bacterium]|nr:choline/ethanolamine kinase family protein [Woeseiaceae bacterium]
MNDENAVRAIVDAIPGWEGAHFSRLPGGLTNTSYLLESDGNRAVLKVDAVRRSLPLNSRAAEAAVQSLAAEHGLANRVLYQDDTVYLTEYVEGDVWSAADFDNDDKLMELAAVLKRVHALPLTGRVFNAIDAAEHYIERLTDDVDPLLAERAIATVREHWAPANLCCCHNDLVAENILETDRLRFLDWEYACDNDPFFDLATIVAHHRLSTAQANLLLDAYFGGDGEKWAAQLVRQERLYEALTWLWQASRPPI